MARRDGPPDYPNDGAIDGIEVPYRGRLAPRRGAPEALIAVAIGVAIGVFLGGIGWAGWVLLEAWR